MNLVRRVRLARAADQRDAGVTLIEVVIAAVLLGILASAVLGIVLQTQKTEIGNRARIAAANLAAREIDLVRDEFGRSDAAPLAIANAGTVTNPHPLDGGVAGQPLVLEGTAYTVVRSVAWNITGNGTSACTGGSMVVYPTLGVTVTVTWPSMGSINPVTSSAVMSPKKGDGIPGTASFIAVKVTDAAGQPNPGRSVRVTGGSEVRSGLTDDSGCAVLQVNPPSTGTSYTAQLTDAGFVDISGTSNPLKSVGTVLQGQLKTNVSFAYDQAGTVVLRLVDPSGGVLDPSTITGEITLVASETSGATSTQSVPVDGTSLEYTKTGLWPTNYGAYFGSTPPGAGYASTKLTPGGTLVIDVPVEVSTGQVAGMPAGTTQVWAVPGAGGTCTAANAKPFGPPFTYSLIAGSWSFFAEGPTFACSPGPASQGLVGGSNDQLDWAVSTLQVTGAPTGGTLWALDAGKVSGTLSTCPGGAYAGAAVNVDAARASAVVLPAGSWYVYRTSGGAGDACLGVPSGKYPYAVAYGVPTTLGWAFPNATVTVSGAPTGNGTSMAYGPTSSLTCTKTSTSGTTVPKVVVGSTTVYQSVVAPGTWYYFSWNQTTGVCALGGSVNVGGQTAYTLPFSTNTKPVVGP